MKKRLSILIVVLLLCLCLFGCGSSSKYDTNSSVCSDDYYSENDTATESPEVDTDGSTSDAGAAVIAGSGADTDLSEKIIYTAWADIETTEFDSSIDSVYALLDEFGAFVQNSYVTGNSYSTEYYGYQSYRTAEFTLRVPRENYTSLTSALDRIGNVLSLNSSIENITPQYTDVESRLDTYRIEEDRLQAMLEQADTVEDMITIESRLSEVRYQIEDLTSTLRDMDNQVNYSTVTLSISEVKKLSEQVSVQRTYWEEMGDGIKSTFKAIGTFFKGLFLGFVVLLPVLIILAVIALIIILIVIRCKRKKKAKIAKQSTATTPENKDNNN